MSERTPPLYCTLTLIAMHCRETRQNKDKSHDEARLQFVTYIWSRIGWVHEENLQVMVVENFPKHTYGTYVLPSIYGVDN